MNKKEIMIWYKHTEHFLGGNVKVKCIQCGTEIYDCKAVGNAWSGTAISASDFDPLSPTDPAPKDEDEPRCPRCNEVYCMIRGNSWYLLLEGDYWWPSPPPQIITR